MSYGVNPGSFPFGKKRESLLFWVLKFDMYPHDSAIKNTDIVMEWTGKKEACLAKHPAFECKIYSIRKEKKIHVPRKSRKVERTGKPTMSFPFFMVMVCISICANLVNSFSSVSFFFLS